jgi:hypothetical protein
VAAHTDQGRDADLAQVGPQVDPADAGLPAGPPRRRPPLIARLDPNRRDQAGVNEGGLGVQLLEPLEPTQPAPVTSTRIGVGSRAEPQGVWAGVVATGADGQPVQVVGPAGLVGRGLARW